MVSLPTFELPLPQRAPPTGYSWSDCDLSILSTTTAFYTGLDQRGRFLGIRRCVICGTYGTAGLEHCHIIMDSAQWEDLKKRRWIPSLAKALPRHELRDGMIMCATHHRQFDSYLFFIRFFPDVRLIRL